MFARTLSGIALAVLLAACAGSPEGRPGEPVSDAGYPGSNPPLPEATRPDVYRGRGGIILRDRTGASPGDPTSSRVGGEVFR